MLSYYPPIKPYATHRLTVTPPHLIYVEECGNPDGLPILFVHGGPGGGCSEDHRCFFDPTIYRIILFDQRGCGRSTPHAELHDNTTQALVNDMEVIRCHLNIDRWLLFGGSWGSTLSLVYAQTHPTRVIAMILRGVFLARRSDFTWFYQDGINRFFPDHWADFLKPIAPEKRGDLLQTYYELLTGDDEIARMGAAKAWSLFEGRCASLRPNPRLEEHFADPHLAVSLARLECHYFVNRCFLNSGQILRRMSRIQHIPSIIVHGRYDVICTLDNAWDLHQRWPGSELDIIRDAGHAASEPGTTDALIRATRRFATRFSETVIS